MDGANISFSFIAIKRERNVNKEREKRDSLRALCVGNPLSPCGHKCPNKKIIKKQDANTKVFLSYNKVVETIK